MDVFLSGDSASEESKDAALIIAIMLFNMQLLIENSSTSLESSIVVSQPVRGIHAKNVLKMIGERPGT